MRQAICISSYLVDVEAWIPTFEHSPENLGAYVEWVNQQARASDYVADFEEELTGKECKNLCAELWPDILETIGVKKDGPVSSTP